ncbi:pentapeptide repeat-containing protein [Streptomyces sp. NPDC088910]|uniref:pentapeptide repeat-containing protein n=1 Tax=Streptomyces sp. NPDC088910 TaxID=3365911 RepID=UPI0037F7F2D2
MPSADAEAARSEREPSDVRDATDLHDADLDDAGLHDSDLHDADLHDADLHDADLHDASDIRDASHV